MPELFSKIQLKQGTGFTLYPDKKRIKNYFINLPE
jgi:hypothetical protein